MRLMTSFATTWAVVPIYGPTAPGRIASNSLTAALRHQDADDDVSNEAQGKYFRGES